MSNDFIFCECTETRECDYCVKISKQEDLMITKSPASKDLHIGLELEFFVPEFSSEDALFTLLGADLIAADLDKYCALDSDGSIDHDCMGTGVELKIMCKQKEIHRILPKVLKVLRKHGAEVNVSCGVHVHLDMRSRDVSDAYAKLAHFEEALFSIVPARRRQSPYCQPVGAYDLETWRRHAAYWDRYRSINCQAFRRHHTLEVRVFPGSLNSREILTWVDLLLYTLKTPRLPRAKMPLKEVAQIRKLPESVVQRYLKDEREAA